MVDDEHRTRFGQSPIGLMLGWDEMNGTTKVIMVIVLVVAAVFIADMIR